MRTSTTHRQPWFDALGNKPYDPPMQVAGKNADGWVYVEPPVSTGTVISIGGDDPRKAAGMCGGSASYNQNPCEDDELVTVTHKSGGINCETDVKVGMDGKAFSEEQMKNAEPWQRDLWDLSQRIDKAIEPWVPLILIIAGVAAGGKGGGGKPSGAKPVVEVPKGGPITGGLSPATSAGSTGRTVATSLQERMAMAEVQSNPAGKQLPLILTDSRWPSSDGWVKMSQNVNGIEIHYVKNTRTGVVDDFKFK
jgi:hypothetical protein